MRRAPQERFWSRVVESPDGCLNFTVNGNVTGKHAQFWLDGRYEGAHRFAYISTYGVPEKGTFICHTCDNPSCVNPEHLYAGTNQDNQIDAIERGQRKNFANPQAKKVMCPYRHRYDGFNSRGDRICNRCMRRRTKEYLIRKRGYSFA